MNLDDFSTEIENRRYIKPGTSLGEQQDFIQKFRNMQGKQNAEIKASTQNLGTSPISSSAGGLTGGENYFNARYQTPQTNATIANLKAAAQAQALNEVMEQELGVAQHKLYEAQRAADKRRRKRQKELEDITLHPPVPSFNPNTYNGGVHYQDIEDNDDAYHTESKYLFDYVDPIKDFEHKMGRKPTQKEIDKINNNIKKSEEEKKKPNRNNGGGGGNRFFGDLRGNNSGDLRFNNNIGR